ncbi:MAG: GGDEF domain-containing protein [Acetatifactor sp.]|nr:GGDEF domain-containing protein [Acetatifactor sp.]
MDKIIYKMFLFFLILATAIVAVYAIRGIGKNPGGMFAENTEVVAGPIGERTGVTAYSADFDASEIRMAGGCLSFTTVFKEVYVYADDELIYENSGSGSVFIRSTGNVWHAVSVPVDCKVITVNIKSIYGDSPSLTTFIAGNYYNIRAMLVRDSSLALVISLLDIVFGLGIVIYFYIIGRFNAVSFKLFPFGITAILIGIWSAGETNAMMVLFSNRVLAAVFAFMLLVLIPIPYVVYIHFVLWPEDRWMYRVPEIISLFNFVLVIGLAAFGIMDLKESVVITHSIWAVSVAYVLVAAFHALRSNKVNKDKNAVFNCAAMLILVAVASIEVIYYWTGLHAQNDVLGRSLLLAYITLLGFRGIIESIKDIEKGRRAEYYRKLANTDSTTGLLNRMAFNNDVDKLKKEDEYSIVSMDLNNLKKVNDTKGHQAGDRYIINASNIIRNVFGNDGSCYRIGGDEFCAIIKRKGSGALAEALIRVMNEEIEKHNASYTEDPVSIAWGYDTNTSNAPRPYSEVLYSADEKMYENKRLQKSKAEGVVR